MNRKYLIVIGTLVLLGAVIASYMLWNNNRTQPVVAQNVEVQPSPPMSVPTPKSVPTPISVVVIPSFPPLSQADPRNFDYFV
jgi:hypothetical protein